MNGRIVLVPMEQGPQGWEGDAPGSFHGVVMVQGKPHMCMQQRGITGKRISVRAVKDIRACLPDTMDRLVVRSGWSKATVYRAIRLMDLQCVNNTYYLPGTVPDSLSTLDEGYVETQSSP